MIPLSHEAILQIENVIGITIKDVRYKFDCYWSQKDGWHFIFGEKRMWEAGDNFVVADYVEENDMGKPTKEPEYKQMWYTNHEHFGNMEDALDYMRTGER